MEWSEDTQNGAKSVAVGKEVRMQVLLGRWLEESRIRCSCGVGVDCFLSQTPPPHVHVLNCLDYFVVDHC